MLKNLGIAILVSAVGFGGSMLVFATEAWPHDAPTGWKYPWRCCSNRDCRQLPDAGISEPSAGQPYYTIMSTGETIIPGDTRIQDSPDGLFHICAHTEGIDAGHTICLFVPPRSF